MGVGLDRSACQLASHDHTITRSYDHTITRSQDHRITGSRTAPLLATVASADTQLGTNGPGSGIGRPAEHGSTVVRGGRAGLI